MNWCNPSLNNEICMNWTCKNCNNVRGAHLYIPPHNCLVRKKDSSFVFSKKVFKFLHNNNCTVECQMKYKVEQCLKNS